MMENNWVSVNKKLPDRLSKKENITGFVLCYCDVLPINGGAFQRTLFYNHKEKRWYLDYKTSVVWNITHWQPLPKPPEIK